MQPNHPHAQAQANGAYWSYAPQPPYHPAYAAAYARMPWPSEPPVTPSYLTLKPSHCSMTVQQHPEECLVTLDNKEKTRKTIDPPPVVEFEVSRANDPNQYFMSCPNVFCYVTLVEADTHAPVKRKGPGKKPALMGTFVSSIHKLKDTENKDGGYFVFPDISCREVGDWKLKFSVMEVVPAEPGHPTGRVNRLGVTFSNVFSVLPAKDFKGVAESTYLSRAFSDQGVRIRLRKEPRSGKRSFDDREERRTPPDNNGQPYTPETDGSSLKRARYSGDFESIPGSGSISVDSYPSQGLAVRPPTAHSYLSPPTGSVYPAATLHEAVELPYAHMGPYGGYGSMNTSSTPVHGMYSNGHNPFGEPLGHGHMRSLDYGLPTSNGLMGTFDYATAGAIQHPDDRVLVGEGYSSLPVQPTVTSNADSHTQYVYAEDAFNSDDQILDTSGFDGQLSENLFPVPKSHYSEKVARARDDLLQAGSSSF